ncbi:signal peptidase I [Candidatus Bathyarchaeota archaeon]|nr:signal peptidase I [Candidatus Bathyarchaeota archaeon]
MWKEAFHRFVEGRANSTGYRVLGKVKKVCLFVLPFLVCYMALQGILHTSEPLAVSKGYSMEPTIREGDILVFRGVSTEEVKVGDVLLFQVPDEMVGLLPERITHRVVEIRKEAGVTYFRTKGDNAPLDTFEIPADKVVGLNIAVIPYVGAPILFAQSPIGMGAIMVLIVASERRGAGI